VCVHKRKRCVCTCVCVCVCVFTFRHRYDLTIGWTQCAHKLAFINNPKRLGARNWSQRRRERERERERERNHCFHTRNRSLYYNAVSESASWIRALFFSLLFSRKTELLQLREITHEQECLLYRNRNTAVSSGFQSPANSARSTYDATSVTHIPRARVTRASRSAVGVDRVQLLHRRPFEHRFWLRFSRDETSDGFAHSFVVLQRVYVFPFGWPAVSITITIRCTVLFLSLASSNRQLTAFENLSTRPASQVIFS
jgi:hypothetical protein